jgi:NAD(P)-dependent dehydrogenase (short-subunit alcohol dehydrogenase family)
MKTLSEKTALVTGGAQGIGFSICRTLGEAGCHIIAADINEVRLQEATSQLAALGCSSSGIRVDVTREDSVRAMVGQATAVRGPLGIFVSSAGVPQHVAPSIGLETREWERVISVNLLGVFLCCREVGALMARQGGGKIINIASLNAVSPAALTLAYNVAKAGVVSLTQTFALELAPCGVNVNCISPGPTETEFHDVVMPERAKTLGISREAMVERVRASIPMGRWGKPEDIARTVHFLASDESSWITGQNFVVAGGLTGVAASPSKHVILGGTEPPLPGS